MLEKNLLKQLEAHYCEITINRVIEASLIIKIKELKTLKGWF